MAQISDPFCIIKNVRKSKQQSTYIIHRILPKKPSSWTATEHQQYLIFFQENMELLRLNCSSKAKKMFIRMSKYILTRSPQQIKSHHQKMMAKHRDLQTVIQKTAELLNITVNFSYSPSVKSQLLVYEEESQSLEEKPEESRSKTQSFPSFSDQNLFDIIHWDNENTPLEDFGY